MYDKIKVYVPSFFSHEGVATGTVSPGTIDAGCVAVPPVHVYRAKVARDGRLAAAEPRALVAVASSSIQAHAGADTAGVVAPVLPALQERQRVAPNGRELVARRRDQQWRLGVVEYPGGHSMALGGFRRVVADVRHRGEDAHLAGLHRDVDDLDISPSVWPGRVKTMVAGEAEVLIHS